MSKELIMGGFARMNFMDFFVYKGKPSIFFAVELGAIASFIVLYFLFRRHKERTKLISAEQIKSWVPTFILVLMIFALAISSFLDTGFSYMGALLSHYNLNSSSLLPNPNNTIRASQHGYSSTEAAFYLLDIARRIKCRRVEKINLLASREYRGIFPFGNRLSSNWLPLLVLSSLRLVSISACNICVLSKMDTLKICKIV